METGGNNPFELKDHFRQNPFKKIYSKKSGDTHFFNAHFDYWQHLRYLEIIWDRVKNEYKELGAYNAEGKLSPELNEMQIKCQCDCETFIIFSSRFMDKVSKIVEPLIEYRDGKTPVQRGFTQHKNWFLEHDNIHPQYSKFLKEKSHWYERDLKLLRDWVVIHGGTFSTTTLLSSRSGVGFTWAPGMPWTSVFEVDYRNDFLKLKKDYDGSDLQITGNDNQMLDEFLRGIRKSDKRLKDEDIRTMQRIVNRHGATVDAEYLESIASHIENFLQETVSIFKE
jgi:hypothetical protein